MVASRSTPTGSKISSVHWAETQIASFAGHNECNIAGAVSPRMMKVMRNLSSPKRLDEVRIIPYIAIKLSTEAFMGALLREESTITAKGQTTVPKSVRQALGVDSGDRIAFFVDDQRRVYVQKAEAGESADPVIGHFLEFLAQDMAKHPDRSIVPFPKSLLDRAVALTAGMGVDLDAEIEGDVAI